MKKYFVRNLSTPENNFPSYSFFQKIHKKKLHEKIASTSYPFSYTIPASNSAGQYKIVGSDSIYFPQGGLTVNIDGTGSYETVGNGGHFSFSGNLLTITQNVTKDSTFEDSGEAYHMIETANASIVLEKK